LRPGWEYLRSTIGYYYYNEHYTFSDLEVIIEVSSYNALQEALDTKENVVDKMVFHSSGNLTSGWDPVNNILKSYSMSGCSIGTDW